MIFETQTVITDAEGMARARFTPRVRFDTIDLFAVKKNDERKKLRYCDAPITDGECANGQ